MNTSDILKELENITLLHLQKPEMHEIDSTTPLSIKQYGLEALGEYRPSTGEIIIFKNTCEAAATELGLESHHVRTVVLVHEMAHAVHHMGRANDGQPVYRLNAPGGGSLCSEIWRDFPRRTPKCKELLAQAHTWSCLEEKRKDLVEVLFQLTDGSPPIYQSWRLLRDRCDKDFTLIANELLWELSGRLTRGRNELLKFPRPENVCAFAEACGDSDWTCYDG